MAQSIIDEIGNFFWAMSQWAYAYQLIYTATVFPYFFKQAEVEWFEEDLKPDNTLKYGEMKFYKIKRFLEN